MKRRVTVRVLADHVSSRKVANSKETFAELDRIGMKWEYMLPVMPLNGKYQRPDLRNHRNWWLWTAAWPTWVRRT